MSNATPNTDAPIWRRSSVTLNEARQMLHDHGYLTSVHDLGSDGVTLYAAAGTGVVFEHVQDTDNGRILTMHLRHTLGL